MTETDELLNDLFDLLDTLEQRVELLTEQQENKT